MKSGSTEAGSIHARPVWKEVDSAMMVLKFQRVCSFTRSFCGGVAGVAVLMVAM
jgi:hypothetical protein